MSEVSRGERYRTDNANCNTFREHLYKILVIGEYGVGKTSLIKRYTEGVFSENYKLTIGVDFALKHISWDDHTKINLQLWDIAGHERFGHMTRVYYKYAIAAILVFDIARPATFDAAQRWLDDVNSKVMLRDETPIPVMLLANKCDIPSAYYDIDRLNLFCETNKLLGWFPTSAKENINLDKAIHYLLEKVLELSMNSERQSLGDTIRIDNHECSNQDNPLTEDKKCCLR